MKIDVNGVSITLTKEQLEEINKQQTKPFDFKSIKSFEDACNHLGVSTEIPYFTNIGINNTRQYITMYKLDIIIRAINNGWKSDFTNKNQYKYYPYFEINDSGVGLFYNTDFNLSVRYLPLTLYLESDEKAKYMGKTFTDLYNEL